MYQHGKGILPDSHFTPTDVMRHQYLRALMHYGGILGRIVGTGWSRRKLYLVHRMAVDGSITKNVIVQAKVDQD